MIEFIKQLLILLLAIAIVYGSYKTISYAQRNLKLLIYNKGPLLIMRASLVVVGGIIGSVLGMTSWWPSQTLALVGIPIPWAIWEYTNGHWEDFVSPVSLLPWAADFILGLALVHLPVVLIYSFRNRKSRRATMSGV